jgi:hypothetical protein
VDQCRSRAPLLSTESYGDTSVHVQVSCPRELSYGRSFCAANSSRQVILHRIREVLSDVCQCDPADLGLPAHFQATGQAVIRDGLAALALTGACKKSMIAISENNPNMSLLRWEEERCP